MNKIYITIKVNLSIFIRVWICHEFINVFLCQWLSSGMHDISKLLTINETILVPVYLKNNKQS